MYKDKDKQKEANRLAAQRRRDKNKGMTTQGDSARVIPKNVIPSRHTQDTAYEVGSGSTKPEQVVSNYPSNEEPFEVSRHDELVTDDYGDVVGVKPHKQAVRSRTTGCKCAIPGDEDYTGIVTKELAAKRGWKLIAC